MMGEEYGGEVEVAWSSDDGVTVSRSMKYVIRSWLMKLR